MIERLQDYGTREFLVVGALGALAFTSIYLTSTPELEEEDSFSLSAYQSACFGDCMKYGIQVSDDGTVTVDEPVYTGERVDVGNDSYRLSQAAEKNLSFEERREIYRELRERGLFKNMNRKSDTPNPCSDLQKKELNISYNSQTFRIFEKCRDKGVEDFIDWLTEKVGISDEELGSARENWDRRGLGVQTGDISYENDSFVLDGIFLVDKENVTAEERKTAMVENTSFYYSWNYGGDYKGIEPEHLTFEGTDFKASFNIDTENQTEIFIAAKSPWKRPHVENYVIR